MAWKCPNCQAVHDGPDAPPLWELPKRFNGDHRAIYTCAFCKQAICINCYVQHIGQKHSHLYQTTGVVKPNGN